MKNIYHVNSYGINSMCAKIVSQLSYNGNYKSVPYSLDNSIPVIIQIASAHLSAATTTPAALFSELRPVHQSECYKGITL